MLPSGWLLQSERTVVVGCEINPEMTRGKDKACMKSHILYSVNNVSFCKRAAEI